VDVRRLWIRSASAGLVAWLVAAGAAGADPPSREFLKELTAGRGSIVPYLSVEPYYDSRYETVNRVRLITGAAVAWSRRTAIETNVTYQYDSRSSTKELFALNVILRVFFDASRTR
jgi:hypothetical protein